ncbi:MAG: protein kinase [Planctomycetota bacterium]
MAPDPQSPADSSKRHDATEYFPSESTDPKPPGKRSEAASATQAFALSGADYSLTEEVCLGEFRLLRRLGRGGMSEVYLAEQTLLKRHVAIKVMRPELMLDETLRQRFQKEALAVAGLNHPNIVQVYTVGEADSRIYIAQEYVNGQNLREYLTRKGPPDLQVAVHIMKQVAAALQAAGQAGIVHRDIKPENIMLARKGEVKVADFGLAKRNETSDSQELTQVGTTMGTPLYMSPEQINGRNVDQRSDLYSFGVTCYHMLAGQAPFRGENAISTALQHLKETAKPLEKFRPDLPPLLCRIIHKLMEKDPDQRYQTAAAVIKDLKRLAQEKFHGNDIKPLDDRPRDAVSSESVVLRMGRSLRNPAQFVIHLVDLPPRRQLVRLAVTCLVILACFAGIGWARRPPNPLLARVATAAGPAPLEEEKIPVKASPREQWYLANTLATNLAAWKAVTDNFPDDGIYTPQAMIKLGLLHLAENRPKDAQEYFDRLIAYGEINPPWQAAGWLGQAMILNQQGNYAQSQQLLSEKGEMLKKSLPDHLRADGLSTLKSNLSHLNQDMDEKLRKIFEKN